jgi:hypothetical protein
LKTSYVTIASRRGGGRGKLVTSLFLRAQGLGDPLVSRQIDCRHLNSFLSKSYERLKSTYEKLVVKYILKKQNLF